MRSRGTARRAKQNCENAVTKAALDTSAHWANILNVARETVTQCALRHVFVTNPRLKFLTIANKVFAWSRSETHTSEVSDGSSASTLIADRHRRLHPPVRDASGGASSTGDFNLPRLGGENYTIWGELRSSSPSQHPVSRFTLPLSRSLEFVGGIFLLIGACFAPDLGSAGRQHVRCIWTADREALSAVLPTPESSTWRTLIPSCLRADGSDLWAGFLNLILSSPSPG